MPDKPQIDIPDHAPSYQLELDDIEVGDGDEATPGSIVEVHYAGVAWSTGNEFDASWNRGETFKFGLGVRASHFLLGTPRVRQREVLAQLGAAHLALARRLGVFLAHSGGSSPKTRRQISAALLDVTTEASAPRPASRPAHSSRLTISLSVMRGSL
jgi:hypothetical protein